MYFWFGVWQYYKCCYWWWLTISRLCECERVNFKSEKTSLKSHFNCLNRLAEYAWYTNLLLRHRYYYCLCLFIFGLIWVRLCECEAPNELTLSESSNAFDRRYCFFIILLLPRFVYRLINFPFSIHVTLMMMYTLETIYSAYSTSNSY